MLELQSEGLGAVGSALPPFLWDFVVRFLRMNRKPWRLKHGSLCFPRGHCLGIRLAIFHTFGMICEGEKRVFAMGLAKGSEPW